MKKMPAWTMAELVVAIIILIILSGACLSVFKPNVQKQRILMYAAMKNITAANMSIMEKNNEELSTNFNDGRGFVNNVDWYCIHLADALNLQNVNCAKGNADLFNGAAVNMTLPGGATITGLTNNWVAPYGGADYKVKNIVVDTNGGSGPNRLGHDKFPLRIFYGSGYSGIVQVVGCGGTNDKLFNETNNTVINITGNAANPYCDGGTANFPADNKVMSFDIYRADTDEEETQASLIASAVSPLEADCGAYGGEGFYKKGAGACDGNYRIKPQCATTDLCATCSTGSVCPLNENGVSENCTSIRNRLNPSDLPCFTLQHKPSGGTGFLLETMVGQFD